ncbi:MAG: hypothetical protein AB7H88_19340 [Vicinamibacterales bacterium]
MPETPLPRRVPCTVLLAVAAAVLATVALAAAQRDYPAVYRDHGLPELAGATVTSTGRQATSLRDGIRIDLETPMAVQDVLAAYREQMAPLGWSETPPRTRFQSPMLGRAEFTKGTLTFSVTATRLGEVTTINLNLLEK